jgi:hypothetical protein
MQTPEITDRSKELFIAFAKDAADWGGTPLVGGNVGGSKEDRGNLTQLKKAGLLTTFGWEGDIWVKFTDTGIEYAKQNGVDIEWIKKTLFYEL